MREKCKKRLGIIIEDGGKVRFRNVGQVSCLVSRVSCLESRVSSLVSRVSSLVSRVSCPDIAVKRCETSYFFKLLLSDCRDRTLFCPTMRPGSVIPAKAGIQIFVKYRDMDTGFRQYDALLAFWDKLTVLSLQNLILSLKLQTYVKIRN